MKPYPTQENYLRTLNCSFKDNIHEAVRFAPIETVLERLNKNPSLTFSKSRNGNLPMHEACLRGDIGLVEILLRFGGNINVTNDYIETPLHFAAKRGSLNLVDKLLQLGADLTPEGEVGNTVLHYAVQGGNVFLVHYLLEVQKLNTKTIDKHGDSLVHVACSYGHAAVFNYLLKKFQPLELICQNTKGNTPLHLAVLHGHDEMAFKLIYKADSSLLSVRNHLKFTALDLARQGRKLVHKNLASELESMTKYTFLNPNKLRGHECLWWTRMLGPFIAYPFMLMIASSFDNKGPPMLVAVAIILTFNMMSSHRIDHMSRWQNPFQASLFAAGMSYTSFYFLFGVSYYVTLDYLLACICLFVATLFGLYHYITLLKHDPGKLTHSKLKATGELFTILDVARGEVDPKDFCCHCELVLPMFSHHCNLCGKCFEKYDHHCLFLYTCIAAKNHRNFIFFVILLILMMSLFLYLCCGYIGIVFPGQVVNMELVGAIFASYPALWSSMILNFLGLVWVTWLFYQQFKLVSRGGLATYVVFKNKSQLNLKQKFMNCIHFVFKKPPYAMEPLIMNLVQEQQLSISLR